MTLPEDTAPGQRFDEDHHPRQRKSDQGVSYWAGWLYRHLVPAIAIAVAALAVSKTQGKVDRAELKANQARSVAKQQQAGRAVAVDVLCGGVFGIETAGKHALDGTLKGLHGQGVPASATSDYVSTISHAVIKQAGVDARKVLRADGRLDCDKLRVAAAAVHP